MLAFLMLTAATAMLPKPGDLKSFGDWSIGCDNVHRCTAVSLMEMESGENQLTVAVTRGGDRADMPRLSIANIETRRPGELTMVVDGTVTLGSATPRGEDAPFELTLTPSMIAALKVGKAMELRDAGGASLGGASLKGIVAALLYMDDRQGRAKSETALVASGTPATATVGPSFWSQPNSSAQRSSTVPCGTISPPILENRDSRPSM